MDSDFADTGKNLSPDLSLSYHDAGVNIDAGNALVDNIKTITEKTRRPEVMSGLGGFGGLFELPAGYREPVLVSATDGVGTKLKLAMTVGKHGSIGIDLVAMCVNDLIVCGAEPLYFLDYFATGQLDVDLATEVVKGIGKGCEMSGCALIGGETAEMPGMYHAQDYDVAGFAVGIVEKSAIIDPGKVQVGDKLIGMKSSGPHSNGYSLIRKIIEYSKADLSMSFADSTLGETLLAPTEIYVKAMQHLSKKVNVSAVAHITGGGFIENIPRVLPPNTRAIINTSAWDRADIFDWIQTSGNVSDQEMYRTFNCGIGLVIAVPAEQSEDALEILNGYNRGAIEIGTVAASTDGTSLVSMVA